MVDQALERASALTRRLLDFSRRRAGTPQVLSPLELLRRDEPLLKQAIGSKVRLRIIHGGDGRAIAPVRIDPTEFTQVTLNLAVNARDAMPNGGELVFDVSTLEGKDSPATFDLMPEGTWTLIRAIDCGEGMSPDVLAHAFEPFFTTKPADRGTGLGLPTVSGIVTAAGGHIKTLSTVGRGTEFRIYLPAARR
jgi:two-component system cell cycle sensor histidine kinase/response regulator CckA